MYASANKHLCRLQAGIYEPAIKVASCKGLAECFADVLHAQVLMKDQGEGRRRHDSRGVYQSLATVGRGRCTVVE